MKRYNYNAICKCGETYGNHRASDDHCPKGKNKAGDWVSFYAHKEFELETRKAKILEYIPVNKKGYSK